MQSAGRKLLFTRWCLLRELDLTCGSTIADSSMCIIHTCMLARSKPLRSELAPLTAATGQNSELAQSSTLSAKVAGSGQLVDFDNCLDGS